MAGRMVKQRSLLAVNSAVNQHLFPAGWKKRPTAPASTPRVVRAGAKGEPGLSWSVLFYHSTKFLWDFHQFMVPSKRPRGLLSWETAGLQRVALAPHSGQPPKTMVTAAVIWFRTLRDSMERIGAVKLSRKWLWLLSFFE